MTGLKRLFRGVDLAYEAWTLLCLVAVVFVVLWQIFGREFLDSTPAWSEETGRVLLVWIGFLSAGIGFREGAHIALSFVVDRMPAVVRTVLGRFAQLLILGFGAYLLVQGAQFTIDTRVATLPGTGLPRSVLYVMMPVAGFMICLYTVLQICGVRTQRYVDSPDDADYE
ncbi:TRAP transporter small permease [Nocardioides insulae]|uniref:TRAP transporter small permease n=1 Tax=Nocardioides insulae TaxID=394734 RepID=UPI00041426BC|nr:TRAP transporter small permease [Nocardioides insulae]